MIGIEYHSNRIIILSSLLCISIKILLFLRTHGVVGSNFNAVDCFAIELNAINRQQIDKLSAPKLLLIHYIVLVLVKNIIVSIWALIKTIDAYSTSVLLLQANNKTVGELTARLASVGGAGDGDGSDVKRGAKKKKQERELIVESREMSSYNPCMKLLYNISKFVLNYNFDQLDITPIGSEQIQTCIKRHPDRCNNLSNIAPNINLHSNSVVSRGSDFKYWNALLFSDDSSLDYNTNLNDSYNIGDDGNVEMSIKGNNNNDLNEYDNGFSFILNEVILQVI